ncbi:MAG: MATE family efflux transporter, partial [Pseudomonadota bacterium]
QPLPVAQGAGVYLQIAGWGIFPSLLMFLTRSYLSALERTKIVLWVTLGAVVANGVLNWAFIFGNWGAPELGIAGSAIASVAVQVLMAAGLIWYAVRQFPEHKLFVRIWRPDWEYFRRVFRLGWPIGLTNLAEVGLFSFSAVMVGWLGTVPLASHGIVLQLASATFMFHLGLSNAATIRAGKALGRHAREDLRRGGLVAVALSVAFSLLAVVVFLSLPEVLLGLYLDPDDPAKPEILAIGVSLMVMAALFQTVDGLQVVALGLLRGVQDTDFPMIYAAVSYWLIGLPAGYLGGFVLGGGAVGIWAGLVVGLAAAAASLLWRFWVKGLQRVDPMPL